MNGKLTIANIMNYAHSFRIQQKRTICLLNEFCMLSAIWNSFCCFVPPFKLQGLLGPVDLKVEIKVACTEYHKPEGLIFMWFRLEHPKWDSLLHNVNINL